MANWCYTQYKFKGKQEDIDNLNKDIEKVATELSTKKCYSLPIPEIVKKLNLELPENASQRGYIEGIDEHGLDTNTAWAPCYEFIDVLCKKYNLDYRYFAEELGCAGIWSNDISHEYWDYKYYLYDAENGDDIYADSDKEAIEWVNSDEDGKYTVKSIFEIYNLDDICITKVEYVDE